MQEVTLLGVGKFCPLAFDLLAPVKDFLIFSVYLVPVNGVHHQLGVLTFQLFDHSISGVQ